ncbi:extracellular calcium-sensing receptor-like [Mixophyes fleayi]|uniref:extracellular calcium-sensing receptor-like n=1 Tax=Mixophyes fleayi TaxID=3061075 RepID=UPI003F4D9130
MDTSNTIKYNNSEMFFHSVHHRDYQQLQALIFAIDEINSNPDILPNITLGYHVYDSCGNIIKVIKDVLQIISGHEKEAPNYVCMEHGKLAGFIGDKLSPTTLPMAQLLNVYGYTQISYGARDPLLSDKILYPNFFRTVQNYQAQHVAIAQLLRRFGWNWVGIITSDDDAGDQELLHLIKQFNNYGICTEFKVKVSQQLENHYDIPLEMRKSSTEVIVICDYGYISNYLLSATCVQELGYISDYHLSAICLPDLGFES